MLKFFVASRALHDIAWLIPNHSVRDCNDALLSPLDTTSRYSFSNLVPSSKRAGYGYLGCCAI